MSEPESKKLEERLEAEIGVQTTQEYGEQHLLDLLRDALAALREKDAEIARLKLALSGKTFYEKHEGHSEDLDPERQG